jgi:hypothetical protein
MPFAQDGHQAEVNDLLFADDDPLDVLAHASGSLFNHAHPLSLLRNNFPL